jgi:DNA polymerase-3 subunit beta
MKFECSHEKIFSAISKAEKITGKHPTLPVLSCILCTATTDGRVVFRATNLHTGVEISIPAKVTTPGVCALPGSYFYQVLSGISEEEVILCETEGEVFHIQTKKTRTKLKTLPYDDFPELPKKNNNEGEVIIPVKDFINGIKSVVFAGSNSDIKPELSSIYIYGKDKQLCFVATDAFRLAEKKIPFKHSDNIDSFLLPIKNAQDILKILSESDESIKLFVNDHQIYIELQNIFITAQLTNGNFPDYIKIIPTEHNTQVIILKNDLVQVLRTLPLFSNHYHHVHMGVHPVEHTVFFEAENTLVGEIHTSIDAVISGAEIETGLNARYIQDVLGNINSDSLYFEWIDARKPLIIRGQHDTSFLYLVMPMNRS